MDPKEPSAKGMLKSGIPRDQLFYTSKVPPKMINYEDAKKCVDESLKRTGLDYIDLYLLHAPYGGKEGRLGAWKALVEAVDAGKVKSIGVSNYGVHHLDELEQWQKVCLINLVELEPFTDSHRSLNPKAKQAFSASTKSNSTPGSPVKTSSTGAHNAASSSKPTPPSFAQHEWTTHSSNP